MQLTQVLSAFLVGLWVVAGAHDLPSAVGAARGEEEAHGAHADYSADASHADHADHDDASHADHADHDDASHADHADHDDASHADHADHDDASHADHADRADHADHDDHDDHDDHAGHDDHEDPADHAGHDDHDDNGGHDDVISLTPAEIEEFGIEVGVAGAGTISQELSLPGEVQPNEDRLAHIVPRYAGIVTDVRVGIGAEVERGQVLAVLESDESLAPFEVTTLISGTVIGKHITLGEAAARDRDAFVIADLSTVWVDLTVYQRDIGRVQVGQTVRIRLGQDAQASTGRIAYVTPVVDERTRTATARIVLPNPEQSWRPGMFVTGDVLVESRDVAVAIPETAVHRFEDRTVTFVETSEGFMPRPLRLGDAGGGSIEVLSGLVPGERYVMSGGFTLKAELEKGSFGHAGHAH